MRRKKRRKKKKDFGSKSIICITTIAMLNVMGISYGAWNEGTNINGKISTGNMSARFIKVSDITEKSGKHTYSIRTRYVNKDQDLIKEEVTGVVTVDINDQLDGNINNNDKNVTITGSVIDEAGSDHTVTVKIKNHGTIPIKLKEVEYGSCRGGIKIEPQEEAEIVIKGIEIKPDKDNKDVILIFEQSI